MARNTQKCVSIRPADTKPPVIPTGTQGGTQTSQAGPSTAKTQREHIHSRMTENTSVNLDLSTRSAGPRTGSLEAQASQTMEPHQSTATTTASPPAQWPPAPLPARQ